MKRPGSLAEVARADDRRSLGFALAEMLDQFALERRYEMLVDEPERLEPRFDDGAVCDAYLAAVAVTLARSIERDPPAWALQDGRKLRRPWFAHSGSALRATLLGESPAAFRERNLFVSANVLSRA